MSRTSLARIPTCDLVEARRIANEMNISIPAAIQIYYRKKYKGSTWQDL